MQKGSTMPGPKSLKRRQEDDRSPGPASGRHNKKAGKNKREVTYDTYDEALDGGVEMEEKGERYRDGDKAQRFYEKALDLYKMAYDYEPTFDAAYNQARVLFTLATSFFLPPSSLSYLTTSINLYRHAMTLTQEVLLSLDAAYNLAQAILELAEVLEDLHSDKDEEVRSLRLEAVSILSQVLQGQESFLQRRTPETDAQPEDDISQDPPADEMELDGDEASLEQAASYETYLPTPSTYIDTCLLSLETHLTLWTTLNPPAIASAEDQTVVRTILDQAATMTPKSKQAEVDFGEIKVLLALDDIVWRMHRSEAQLGTVTESQPSLEKATVALTSLLTSLDLNPPEEATLHADILTTLAEVEQTIAHRLMFLSGQAPAGPSQLGQSAWFHLGEAITHLTKALELPTSASTPKTFKSSVLHDLSQASLSRARLARINDTAKRNSAQLIENALAYGTKAAESISWGWLNPTRLASSSQIGRKESVELPWPCGWDAEWLARSIVLQALWTMHVTLNDEALEIAPEAKQRYEGCMKGIVERLKSLEGDRRLSTTDVARWVDELEEAEGTLPLREREWWNNVATSIS
ncbi:hypothetical protein BD324DRAFT_637754 [Kockovaella imperatae]|uniref:Uncharacterized protein n=1 Tax=Kockovaella imperatae TaxID=4999 RepID=A0A1Y1U7D4_9TREE|nr:hypothetical protein BD324DRAFT_637754 [Kockovaella imperatae]ORX33940.1 hypothetical protein BD324DRAFT_637754 [Kockovaella imperatae]